MTKLTKEQVKFFIETMTDDMHNTTQHKIAETLLSKFGECESLQEKLLAYEQAARNSDLKTLVISEIVDFYSGFESPCEPETVDEAQRQLIGRIEKVFGLAAPVLPKQPEPVAIIFENHAFTQLYKPEEIEIAKRTQKEAGGTITELFKGMPSQPALVERLKKVMNSWLAMEPKLAFQPEFTDVMMLLDAKPAPAQPVIPEQPKTELVDLSQQVEILNRVLNWIVKELPVPTQKASAMAIRLSSVIGIISDLEVSAQKQK